MRKTMLRGKKVVSTVLDKLNLKAFLEPSVPKQLHIVENVSLKLRNKFKNQKIDTEVSAVFEVILIGGTA